VSALASGLLTLFILGPISVLVGLNPSEPLALSAFGAAFLGAGLGAGFALTSG
jgi:hypothetical protein